MSDPRENTTDFAGFFREGTAGLLGLYPETEMTSESADQPVAGPPRLPGGASAKESDRLAYWRSLRAFFRSGEGGDLAKNGLYPALLTPFRAGAYVPQEFPYWLPDEDTLRQEPGLADQHHTLQELLARALRAIAPAEGDARILKDNLPRLQLIVQRKLQWVDDAFKASPVLEEAIGELEKDLNIKGGEGEAFGRDLAALRQQLPRTGMLISFTPHLPLHLLAALLPVVTRRRRDELLQETQPLIQQLQEMLAVEKANRPDADSSEHLHDTLDFADSFVKFEELASIMPRGGSEAMPEERLQRIGQILETLENAADLLLPQATTLVLDPSLATTLAFNWEQSFPQAIRLTATTGQVCTQAVARFDQQMEQAARLFAAMRIARLEVDRNYLPAAHDDFFAHFDWRLFSDKEMAACPPVMILADTDYMTGEELSAFSRLLSSNRPVKVMLLQHDPREEMPDPVFRPEVGALAIAHRNPFVLQASAIRPAQLYDGFRDGLSGFAPALFHLLMPVEGTDWKHHFLWVSAAVEGREFPGFRYDSERGPKWGSRFDLQFNPQVEEDWPVHQLGITDEAGGPAVLDLPFTFADFAALHPHFASCFRPVPRAYWTDDLLLLADYLALPAEEAYAKVPFVWMVDAENTLQRAAVAWPLVLACSERLDFWHYLQENAGIHSYHVEQATEKVRGEAEAETERRLADLEAAYRKELETVREETARAAMERLASVLLELDDLEGLPAQVTATAPPRQRQETTPPPVSEPGAQPAPEPETAAEEEELLPLGDAWIDSVLCTSCNECIDINRNIFQYNAEKQAYVANPKGGPFADIVKAAEKCPVGIIHPGAPQNPEEPGLEALVKRAEKFN